jgi:hypothetical protein
MGDISDEIIEVFASGVRKRMFLHVFALNSAPIVIDSRERRS